MVLIGIVLSLLIMAATSGGESTTTTELPDPTILRITTDVAADEHAFDLQLTLVVVADDVTTIGDRAFRDCMSLTRLYLPASLESIGKGAFSGCDALTVIVYAGTIDHWKEITKGNYWSDGVPATEVICSDGIVALNHHLTQNIKVILNKENKHGI